ncbi:hypothetical protein TELCIR_02301 [Teladorsagia circumcincta]|uniref:Uncharacterized protein n=1 Tax=Teladorsagia circumcincta TaxID=45464 RepID=A0A2G9UZK8_TELCI|nr:hypothetical protein TELCIR_02301 [Teladorsagia circumcincta]
MMSAWKAKFTKTQTMSARGEGRRIFGMCNNFAYSVMLGAAQDILKRNSESNTPDANSTEHCVLGQDQFPQHCSECSWHRSRADLVKPPIWGYPAITPSELIVILQLLLARTAQMEQKMVKVWSDWKG